MPEEVATIPVDDHQVLHSCVKANECDWRESALNVVRIESQIDEESGKCAAILKVMTSHGDAVLSGGN